KGTDCKSVGIAFTGSNPVPPTDESCLGFYGKRPTEAWVGCGCSSMVEQQPSKLKTRVRFPSPASLRDLLRLEAGWLLLLCGGDGLGRRRSGCPFGRLGSE